MAVRTLRSTIFKMLSESDSAKEETTRKTFVEAYKIFHEKHQSDNPFGSFPTRNICWNNSSSAFRWSFRKSEMVRKSGWFPAANTRNATSSTNRLWILRDENTPTQ